MTTEAALKERLEKINLVNDVIELGNTARAGEAGAGSVWVATSDEVPGLATEEQTREGLIEKLKGMIPELLEANGRNIEEEMLFEVFTRRFETTHRAVS